MQSNNEDHILIFLNLCFQVRFGTSEVFGGCQKKKLKDLVQLAGVQGATHPKLRLQQRMWILLDLVVSQEVGPQTYQLLGEILRNSSIVYWPRAGSGL